MTAPHDPTRQSDIWQILNEEYAKVQAEWDALEFTRLNEANMSAIAAQLGSLGNAPTQPDAFAQAPFAQVYHKSYEDTLKVALSIINEQGLPPKERDPFLERWSKFPNKLLRQVFILGGKLDAIEYALECEGNTDKIAEAITETENSILEGLASNNLSEHMAPNASPRLYKDGYLSVLKALHLRISQSL